MARGDYQTRGRHESAPTGRFGKLRTTVKKPEPDRLCEGRMKIRKIRGSSDGRLRRE